MKKVVIGSYSRYNDYVFYATQEGYLIGSDGVTYDSHGVRPTLYLSSSVKTTSGDGSIDSPYRLSL